MAVRMGVQLLGPWDRVERFFNDPNKIRRSFYRHATSTMDDIGEEMRKQLRRTILSQGTSVGVRWPRLSKFTERKKGTTYMLLETYTLVNAFKVWRLGPRKWAVGLKDDETHEPSGMTMAQLGGIHEDGSFMAGIPPRPFLGPTVDAYILALARDHAPELMTRILSDLIGSMGAAFGLAGERIL